MDFRICCGLVVASMFAVAGHARSAELVAHYSFDKDFTCPQGSELTLNPVGDAMISSSESQFGGGALLLDGDGDSAWSPDPSFRFLQEDFALAFWYRRNQLKNLFEPLVGWGSSVANTGYAVRLMRPDAKDKPPMLNGILNDDMAKSVSVEQPENQDSAFQHVVLQRKDGVLELYLNGVLVNSTPDVGDTDLTVGEKRGDLSFAFAVGTRSTHSDGTGSMDSFNGLIDEIWVFRSSLTLAEIAALKEKNTAP